MTAILWIVGLSLASFFGIVFYITRRPPPRDSIRRTVAGLWRDFVATRRKPSEPTVTIILTLQEIETLAACKIPVPPKRWYKVVGQNNRGMEVTLPELQLLHSESMAAAQVRIGRAAERACNGCGGALYGTTLHISTAAGYFHALLLQHWQGVERVSQTPIDPPATAPDNAPSVLARSPCAARPGR